MIRQLLVQQTLVVAFNVTSAVAPAAIISRVDVDRFLRKLDLTEPSMPNSSIIDPTNAFTLDNSTDQCYNRTLLAWKDLDLRAYVGEMLDLLLHPTNNPEFVIAFLLVLVILAIPFSTFCCMGRRLCNFLFQPRVEVVTRPCNRRHLPAQSSHHSAAEDQPDLESNSGSPADHASLAVNPPSEHDLAMEELIQAFDNMSLNDPAPAQAQQVQVPQLPGALPTGAPAADLQLDLPQPQDAFVPLAASTPPPPLDIPPVALIAPAKLCYPHECSASRGL